MNKTILRGSRQRQKQRGFTLMELLIAMVIAAILAAIAIPSYSSYIQKSRRSDAKTALLDMAALEERYFSTSNVYTNSPVNLGYPAGTAIPFPVGSSYYNITTITVVNATAPTSTTSVGTPATYTIIATAIGTQTNDTQCMSFEINSAGQQTSTNGANGAGTSTTTTGNCWQ